MLMPAPTEALFDTSQERPPQIGVPICQVPRRLVLVPCHRSHPPRPQRLELKNQALMSKPAPWNNSDRVSRTHLINPQHQLIPTLRPPQPRPSPRPQPPITTPRRRRRPILTLLLILGLEEPLLHNPQRLNLACKLNRHRTEVPQSLPILSNRLRQPRNPILNILRHPTHPFPLSTMSLSAGQVCIYVR